MSKRKILIAAGALVLTVAGYLSSSASKNVVQAVSGYFRTNVASAPLTLFKGSTSSILTTVKRAGYITAFFVTVGGAPKTLFGVRVGNTLSKTLFRNPNF